ncbi:MAG: PilZ domain-containing protein [Candidatus Omnitrophica bacterium]|nr:PilZ domain-containing protein [Candidatus Omnitrophota bacterium]
MNTKTQRKFVRFNAPLYLKISFPNKEESFSAIAKDISLGGAKLVLDLSHKVEREDVLSVFLLLPEKTLNIPGKVVWVKDYIDRKEAGLSFLNFPEIYKEDIYNYIFKYHREEITKKWWQM